MSAERSEDAAPLPSIARQQHTADDIAFALEHLLGRHARAVLARFFTRLGRAA